MKYLIFGNGFIGNKFKKSLKGSEISKIYITNIDEVIRELKEKNPEIVINSTGKTGYPNIDWCEDHKLETISSNVISPAILLEATQKLGIYFIHIGTGCVYQGDNRGMGFSEDDEPTFNGSYYIRTKLMAENILKEFNCLQLRIRMPIDDTPGPKNLITKLLGYKKIISTENSLTVLDDAIVALKKLSDKKRYGIYNVVNPGAITNVEILEMYKKIVDPGFTFSLAEDNEINKLIKTGRSNCVLSTKKLESEGIKLRPVKDAIADILKKYKNNLK